MRLDSDFDSSTAVRSGWASVHGNQPSWKDGWKRMWLVLSDHNVRIFDWEIVESTVIEFNAISRLERVQHNEAPYCCLLGTGDDEFYISYWSNGELQDWMRDFYQLRHPNPDETFVNSNASSLTLSADLFDAQITPHPSPPHGLPHTRDAESSPTTEEPVFWQDHILTEYYESPHQTPTSLVFPSTPRKLTRKPAFKRKSRMPSSCGEQIHQATQSINWATYKHKLYQSLLSLLVMATSLESMPEDGCFVDILRDLFQSIEVLDSISTLFSEPTWLRHLPWEVKKQDEAELVQLLRAISTSKSGYKAVLSLRGDRAQQFLDMAHDILHFPSLQRSTDARFGVQVLKLMIRVSEICHQLPTALFLDDVEMLEKNATFLGSFSNVYRARYLGQTVALKRMRVFESDTETAHMKLRQACASQLTKFCREALVWQHLKHPYVLPFVGIDADHFESLCMVSPWLENGTVLNYLKLNRHKEVDRLLYEIAQGLAYLHSLDVIHGDLRGVNILVDGDGHPRIADFGLAVFADMYSFSTYPGSARWMAPELLYPASQDLVKARRTRASDVYSFACVCVELYTGLPPFYEIFNEATVALKVVAGERPRRPLGGGDTLRMSSEAWILVQSCWSHAYANRPGINTIVKYFKRDILKGRLKTGLSL